MPSFLDILPPSSFILLRIPDFFVLSSLCHNLARDLPAQATTSQWLCISGHLRPPPHPPAAPSHSLPCETLAFSRHVDHHFLSWICFFSVAEHLSLTFHNFSSSLKTQYKCPMYVNASWNPRKSFLSILLYVSVHKAFSKFSCMCFHFPPRWELLQVRVYVLFIFSSSYINMNTHHWVGPQWRLLDDSWKSVGPKWKRKGLRQVGWL